ncbi:MAG: YfjI family protein [Acidithiobacillus ferriphilus]|uniref:YfjI family protein n=1 Tax=Acidithiobacillus ferriphilus TaxID=1689834 RepID=UPI001C06EA55|nr:YfjI family protein [Acidithiobacillus ferriphilus]MBU2828003.1 DUF3987 domain-containing protein [Acidithiobacillus ferriphilus]
MFELTRVIDPREALAAVAVAATEWPTPEPLPVGLPPVQTFNADLLPVALRAYVMDISDRLQCPPDFPAVAFVVALSSLAGARIGIRPKAHDDWLCVPNLWGGVVGRPSVMKTPSMQEPLKMLHRLEALARSRYTEAKLGHETKLLIHKLKADDAKKQAQARLKKGVTEAELVELLRTEEQPKEPTLQRYVVNDSTVEKLGEILQENPDGVLVFRDELVAWLRTLDRDGHEGDRGFYLEAWTGAQPFTYDRIGRGTVHIESVTLAILGGIQPGPLRQYISAATQGGAGDDGLLQRFQLLVWSDVSTEWRNVDRWPDTEAKQAVWRIFERLADLSLHHEESEVPYVRFGPDAQITFDEWRETLEHRLRNEAMAPVLEAHMGKFRSLVPSLALIFHLVDEDTAMLPVGPKHVQRAIAWAEYLETHAWRVYSQALDPALAAAVALSARLDDLPDSFTARDIYRKCWAGLDRESTEKALGVLVEFCHVQGQEESTRGRSTTIYQKNPKLKNNSGNVSRGADKTAKSPPLPPSVSFGSSPTQESENIFPDDDGIDFEEIQP